MKFNINRRFALLSLAALLALGGCSEWTDMESVTIKEPQVEKSEAYMQAIRPVMEQVPVINTPTGLYVEDGAVTGTLTPEGQALVTDFDMLQYYYRKNFIYDSLR